MKAFANALIEVLTARNAAAPSNDLVAAINSTKNNARAIDALFSSKAFAPVAKRLLENLSIVSQADNREDFIAVKVAVKVVRTANALAKNDVRPLDNYSRVIIENLVSLQRVSNKDALVSLSKSIVYNEDEQKAKLISRGHCSAGTAGTQASSTRMMLKNLDICEVLKSKRGDALVLKNNPRAQMLVDMFTNKGEALVTAASAVPEKEEQVKPAAKPAAKAATKPAKAEAKPATKPAAKAPAKTEKPAPATKPASKPATKPAAKTLPVAKSDPKKPAASRVNTLAGKTAAKKPAKKADAVNTAQGKLI